MSDTLLGLLSYPIVLALLPVLALLAAIYNRSKKQNIPFPSLQIFSLDKLSLKALVRTPTLFALACLLATLAVLGASRPHKLKRFEQPQEGRDLILVIDISPSMRERDFVSNSRPISRLDAVKIVVDDFIESRREDRIGLVVFGGRAFLQGPLTRDHELLRQLLSILREGAGGDGTAIGDGIGVALKALDKIGGSSKAIVLLTDGANNSGQVHPLQAAEIAKKLGIKIHTIGIGRAPIRERNDLRSYDEQTLKKIAHDSSGVFFNASNLDNLQNVYEQINQLETRQTDSDLPTQRTEYAHHFAGAASLCLLIYIFLYSTIFARISL